MATPRDRILATCAAAWLRAIAAGARAAPCLDALDSLCHSIALAGQSSSRLPSMAAIIERQLNVALDLGEDGAAVWSELMQARGEGEVGDHDRGGQ